MSKSPEFGNAAALVAALMKIYPKLTEEQKDVLAPHVAGINVEEGRDESITRLHEIHARECAVGPYGEGSKFDAEFPGLIDLIKRVNAEQQGHPATPSSLPENHPIRSAVMS